MPMSIPTVIIGAGQAGLAMSRALSDRSIDHVLLERGEVANAWRTERWDSLRLLTPNWMTRLPGFRYEGRDPDGYMRAGETADFLQTYAAAIDAPIQGGVSVDQVERLDGGRFRVSTSAGTWTTRSVVLATGACGTPKIPALAERLPHRVQQLTPIQYRNPDQVQGGRVLVVGGSASGAQIADELAAAGRDVSLAVGAHVRLPRIYRGMDIHWWMETIGLLDERWTDVDDLQRVRRLPSLQLVGSPERRSLDINTLQERGVQICGRVAGVTDRDVQFSGSLANALTSADLKLDRLLLELDRYAADHGLDQELPAASRPNRSSVVDAPLTLPTAEFGAVIWATGFRPNHAALPDQLKNAKGELIHEGGVVAHPGLYALGLPFLRRRKSTFLDGVGADALELSAHLHTHLDSTAAITATS